LDENADVGENKRFEFEIYVRFVGKERQKMLDGGIVKYSFYHFENKVMKCACMMNYREKSGSAREQNNNFLNKTAL
jgi:hypothetical protein